MRELGLNPANGGMTRTIRRHAALLGLDSSHFRSNRSWSDAVLRQAVAEAHTWEEVLAALGQVKTTTYKGKDGWMVQIGRRPYSIGNNALLVPYDPEVIELFFIVDGDFAIYLIPSRVVAGRVQLLLRAYSNFIVGNVAGLMASRAHAA
jgi:hypothetical protein